jgi:hypothetical protein
LTERNVGAQPTPDGEKSNDIEAELGHGCLVCVRQRLEEEVREAKQALVDVRKGLKLKPNIADFNNKCVPPLVPID